MPFILDRRRENEGRDCGAAKRDGLLLAHMDECPATGKVSGRLITSLQRAENGIGKSLGSALWMVFPVLFDTVAVMNARRPISEAALDTLQRETFEYFVREVIAIDRSQRFGTSGRTTRYTNTAHKLT